MVNLFFPYYQCGDQNRQKEIDFCLKENIENTEVSRLIVLIDDDSALALDNDKVLVIHLDTRPTYKKWIELSNELTLTGISVLCNSDIYFDSSLSLLTHVLDQSLKFVALSRWEVIKDATHLHPNPRWSQDVWAMNCDNHLSKEMLHQLDFPMGVPRCDNKIAYLFGVFGWEVYNPCNKIMSYHVHESDMRTYNKKLDFRILGGVAYVHPPEKYDEPSTLEFDIWVKSSKNIKDVKLNKSLEKWIAEDNSPMESFNVEAKGMGFEPCGVDLLLQAIKSGKSIQRQGPNFELYEHKGEYVFKNAFTLNRPKKATKLSAPKVGNAKLLAWGAIPPVLDTFVNDIGLKASSTEDLNFWQYPCATEKQAFENHLAIKHGEHIDWQERVMNIYVPLPWATYIDRKSYPLPYLKKVRSVIQQYKTLATAADMQLDVHSVCQHIHWHRILEQAHDLGVTNLHLSHKNSKSQETQEKVGYKFTLHGWPLIAVNYVTPERNEGMQRKGTEDKKLLASFIGAHMPHYLDDSRLQLFEAAKASGREDVFVDLGNEWHFNKIVYEEQVLSREIESHHIDEHHEKTFRYNTILSDSVFSLCPIGAGPNTLRFWESIAVGSIPVIFSDDLAVLTENKYSEELLGLIVIAKTIDEQLFEYLSSIRNTEERSVQLIGVYEGMYRRCCFSG